MIHPTLGGEQVLGALTEALEPLDYTRAMREAGATAFQRADEWPVLI